ncbi:MAG: toll/interleukin-1 receptor domain-containing protein [Chloroflexota bacterium]
MTPTSVFISYAREDTTTAKAVHKVLERAQIDVWKDTSNIRGGESFIAKISDAIKERQHFILIFSEHAQASKFVAKEVELATSLHKTIVPLILDKTEPEGSFALPLAGPQRIPVSKRINRSDTAAILGSLLGKQYAGITLGFDWQAWTKPLLIALFGILGVTFSMNRVDTVEIQLDVLARGVELTMNDPTKALFENPVSLSTLIVSGISSYRLSSDFNLPQQDLQTEALGVSVLQNSTENPDGQIALNLDLSTTSELRIVHEEGYGIVDFSVSGLQNTRPDVSVSGNLVLSPQMRDRHTVEVENGLITFIPNTEDDIAFELEVAALNHKLEIRNRELSDIVFQLVDLPSQVVGDRPESMILSGSVIIGEAIGTAHEINEGQELRYESIKGNLESLILEDEGLKLVFRGSVSQMTLGSGNSQQNIMPRRISKWLAKLKNIS